jgi:hypothetical protein
MVLGALPIYLRDMIGRKFHLNHFHPVVARAELGLNLGARRDVA